jgi:drug/metabolite transporter (DMT)-like permease
MTVRLLAGLAIALCAFAANSVLCRLALASGEIGPATFTAVRLASGALALAALSGLSAARAAASWRGAAALFAYAAAFSFAYVSLDAGTGALVLFGAVQATMFAGALAGGERPGLLRWVGGASAMAGLAVLAAPGAGAPDAGAAALMAAAGVAWGLYSLLGRKGGPPLPATAGAFLLAAPAGAALWLIAGADEPASVPGLLLAVLSGALASGAGYAVWYAVLPRLEASLAGVAQLTVPLIALAGGAVVLGEAAPTRFLPAAALILGGVGAATLLSRSGSPRKPR